MYYVLIKQPQVSHLRYFRVILAKNVVSLLQKYTIIYAFQGTGFVVTIS